MGERLPLYAKVVFDNCNVIFGVAPIENEFDQTCRIEVIPAEEIFDREPELLRYAKSRLPRTVWLPMEAFLLEGGVRLGQELLFGCSAYPGAELLRAWTLGSVSRMDALFLLLWLAAALFRICFLTRILRLLAEPFWTPHIPWEAGA